MILGFITKIVKIVKKRSNYHYLNTYGILSVPVVEKENI